MPCHTCCLLFIETVLAQQLGPFLLLWPMLLNVIVEFWNMDIFPLDAMLTLPIFKVVTMTYWLSAASVPKRHQLLIHMIKLPENGNLFGFFLHRLT